MWRAILLGKLAVSILASLVVGGVCALRPWRTEDLTWSQSAQWVGIGSFFLLLGLLQIGVIFLLTRKKV
jgi:protein-S-isoprenylcysteine O-methyltransferase Ste14